MRPLVSFGDPRLPDRFWDKVSPCPMSGCWLWTAYINEHGYGKVNIGSRPQPAHRAAYERLVAPVSSDLVMDHLCRVRCCVNPAHVEPVPQRLNVLRGTSPVARRAAADACDRGHPRSGFDKINRCAQCMRDSKNRKSKSRNRNVVLALRNLLLRSADALRNGSLCDEHAVSLADEILRVLDDSRDRFPAEGDPFRSATGSNAEAA